MIRNTWQLFSVTASEVRALIVSCQGKLSMIDWYEELTQGACFQGERQANCQVRAGLRSTKGFQR